MGKKAITWSVVVLTILWSMGLAALMPLVANAQSASCPSLSAGDLFKVPDNSAVYLLNSAMQRLYFPNSGVYHTWYTDFSGVVTIPNTCVDAYPAPLVLPIGVNPRPGANLVKVVISPSVYVVEPGNKISKLASEQVAQDLYGANWASKVVDVADAFWPNYVNHGTDLTESIPHNGMLVQVSGSNSVYEVKDGSKFLVDGSVRGDVRVVSQSVFDRVATATGSVTAASIYDNPSQGIGSSSSAPSSSPTAAGSVTISLASDTPSGTYAVDSSARVPFTKLVFTAGASDVTITSFKVARGGSPAVNGDFSAINVLDPAGNLLNDIGKTPNSDNLVTFTEDLVIPANSSKVYTLVGDMVSNVGQGNQPRLGLYSVETTASVNASLPLYGNSVETNTNLTLGTVTLAEGVSVGTITKQVGTNNVQFASLKISVATEDFQIGRIVLYNAGTIADADVSNFKLKYNNEVVSNGTMASKYLTFDLASCTDQCKIGKGLDKTFDIYGDIISGSARTMNMDVQRTVHVVAKDLKNGYYVTPTNNASAMTNTVTVSQGKLNVTKTDNVITADVPENASGVALASFNFKVTGEPIDIRTLVFRVSTTGTVVPTGFDSLTLYNAAGVALIGGVDATGSASPGYATTTDTFTLPVGDNLLTFKAKIDSTPNNNDTVRIDIDMTNSSNFDSRGQNSGETITLATYATPQAFVTGNIMTIKTAALRVTALPTPPTTTYAAGTSNVLVAEVLLDAAGSSEDLKVTQFLTKDYADSGAKTIDLQNIRLFVDKDGDSYNGSGSQVALTEVQNGSDSDASDDETFTFNLSGDDQFTVKAGKKLVVSIKANIAGGASTGNHIFRTNAANDVTATGKTTNSTVSEVVDTSPQGQATGVGVSGGTVQVGIDTSNPDAKQVAAGSQGVTLGVFNLYSTTTEDVELDSLTLTQRVTVTASAAFQDYDLLYLVNEAGVTVGSVVPTSTIPFIDLNAGAFIVPKNDSDGVKLTLKANLSNIGPAYNVAVGGHSLGFNIAAAAHVIAKGVQTGTGSVEYLSAGSEAPNGNTHLMYKAIPTFEKLALPSGTLINGSNVLFKFKVTANTGDIGLWKFTFDVSTTGVSLTSLDLFDVTGSQEVQLYSSSTIDQHANVTMIDMFLDDDNPTAGNGGEERTIAAGSSRTFELRGTISGAGSGDSLSTRMAGDAAAPVQSGYISSTDVRVMASSGIVENDTHNDFIWSDRHAPSHSTSTADWTNGYLVSGLSSATTSPAVLSL